MIAAVSNQQQPSDEFLEAVGLTRKARRKGRKGKACADCFFHQRMLCALDLDQPCSTFRPAAQGALVPPRQPALLLRQAEPVPAFE